MIFIVDVIYGWDMQFFNNAYMSGFGQFLLRVFQLISFILISIWSSALKSNLRGFVIGRHLLHLCSGLDFIFRKIIFVAGVAIEGYLGSHISLLWDGLRLDSWRFDVLRFVCRYSFKFDSRSVSGPWHRSVFGSEYVAIFLWVISRFNNIWFILIFIGTLTNERNLEQNFALN